MVPQGMCTAPFDPTQDPTKPCQDGSSVPSSSNCPEDVLAQKANNSKGGWDTDPAGAAKTGWQYLTSIWSDCLGFFEQDDRFDKDGFRKLLTGGITWFDTRNSTVANRTVGSVVGNGDPTKLISAVGPANAVVLGDFSRNVALGVNYFSDLTQTEQIALMIHEALHVQMKMYDPDLKGLLKNFGFEPQAYGSGDITNWISKGCKK